MSATDKADFEVGAVAHVSFRVRCENLSHGEEVFLTAQSDLGRQAKVRTDNLFNIVVLAALFVFNKASSVVECHMLATR